MTSEDSKTREVEEEVPTDIFEAVDQANLHGVKILLKNDAALVKNKDGEGRTPLLCSVMSGPDEISKFLASKGSDVNASTKSGETPLMIAAANKNLDLAGFFVSQDANVNAVEKGEGASVLHKAAESGDAELIKLLLSKGAKANHKRKDGNTPLHIAALGGHFDAVKMLVDHRAKLGVKAKDGTTPEDAAEKSTGPDRKKIVEFLKGAE